MNKFSKDINKYYFNLLLKGDKVFYTIIDDKIYLSDSYIISIINKDDFLLNIEKLINVDLRIFFNKLNEFDYRNIKTWYAHEDIISLLDDNNYKVNINKKYFKLYHDMSFKIFENIKPVIVYNNDEIIGLILPIKVY